MYQKFYTSRKTYFKFDDEHYVLYLNEEAAERQPQQNSLADKIKLPGNVAGSLPGFKIRTEPLQGFTYTGSEPDGGTIISAAGVTQENRREKFIAGLILTRYSEDAVGDILSNSSGYATELADLQEFRRQSEGLVDELLAR